MVIFEGLTAQLHSAHVSRVTIDDALIRNALVLYSRDQQLAHLEPLESLALEAGRIATDHGIMDGFWQIGMEASNVVRAPAFERECIHLRFRAAANALCIDYLLDHEAAMQAGFSAANSQTLGFGKIRRSLAPYRQNMVMQDFGSGHLHAFAADSMRRYDHLATMQGLFGLDYDGFISGDKGLIQPKAYTLRNMTSVVAFLFPKGPADDYAAISATAPEIPSRPWLERDGQGNVTFTGESFGKIFDYMHG